MAAGQETETETEAARYRIGAVSNMTGLTTDTIRAWEKRYQAVSPARSAGGGRSYSDEDVQRLQLLGMLTELGHAIGSLANLSDETLKRRLQHHQQQTAPRPGAAEARGPIRTAVLGHVLAQYLHTHRAQWPSLSVDVAAETIEELTSAEADLSLILLDLKACKSDPSDLIHALRRKHPRVPVVATYEYATRDTLRRLARERVQLIRGPLRISDLRRTVMALVPNAQPSADPRKWEERRGQSLRQRFSDEQLGRLCEMHSSLECECTNHLTSIIQSLLAFERYSRNCASENADDAVAHMRLSQGTARARAQVEALLLWVCERDGIELAARDGRS